MSPYLILLPIVTVLSYLGRRYGSYGIRRTSIYLVGLVLIMFAGLRHLSVGTDTEVYVRHFLSVSSIEDAWRTTEVGYYTLNYLSASVYKDYSILLTLIALIVVSCYMSVFVRLVKRYETAVFLFVALGFYTFFFNGARQGLAASFCFLAIPALLERKPKQYFLIISVAFLFHHTALVAFPLYYLAKPYVKWRQILLVCCGILVFAMFLSVFVKLAAQFIDDGYASYAEETSGGGRVMTAFLVMQGAILFFIGSRRAEDEKFSRLLNVYLLGLVPIVAATLSNVNPSGILRLHIYFSQTALLLWPMYFLSLADKSSRYLIAFAFLLIMVAFFVLTTSSFSHLTPYQMKMPGAV